MIPDHKGETIGKIIESCLLDWGIEKVLTITVDNASANKVAIDYVRRKMRNWNESKLVLGGNFLHVRCCAHIINLIVSDGLKDMNDSIVRIRNAVQYVRSSPSRLQKFKNAAEHERIESHSIVILDVPTRWNSTYLMLSTALKFQKAFDRLLDDDARYGLYFSELDSGKNRVGPPKEDDWDNAKVFVQFLHVFYDITLKFSASLSVTSNMFFHELCSIATELNTLANSGDFLLGEMAAAMKYKFDKYWGKIEDLNKLLIIALVLDPRYKLDYVKFCFGDLFEENKVNEMTYDIKELLIKLYEFYKGVDNISSSDQVSRSIPLENEGDMGKVNENVDFRLERLKKFMQMKEKKDFVDLKNEVERYLIESDENTDDDSFDLLNWWKVNCSKYKILSRIAKDIFAIPVSTVASESAFSTGGRVLDPFRSSLSPKMVEILICLQNWLRTSNICFDVAPSTGEMEFYEALEKEIGMTTSSDDTVVG
ncbi:hypothetical protein LWI29_023987 [Acer saccharum]|uniref:Zinc finger BED domain-containing protein RICESLEEPER 2-like n=1 Tax=Acer saccharum TaxID=4024 RepID=A0AA39RY55_ACESA|nr:hypothetical protein LWI29_023987 [Acer saccharum]